jgi:hypothetical protein
VKGFFLQCLPESVERLGGDRGINALKTGTIKMQACNVVNFGNTVQLLNLENTVIHEVFNIWRNEVRAIMLWNFIFTS